MYDKSPAMQAYESMIERVHIDITNNNVGRVILPVQDKSSIIALKVLNEVKFFSQSKFKIKLVGYDLGDAYPFDTNINKELPPYKRYNLKEQFENTIKGRNLTSESRVILAQSYVIYQCTIFVQESLAKGENAYFFDPLWIEVYLQKYDVTIEEVLELLNTN